MNSEIEWWVWHHDATAKAIWLQDHFGSFDYKFRNYYLDMIPDGYTVYSEYLFPDAVQQAYPKLQFEFSAWLWLYGNHAHHLSKMAASIPRPPLEFENFLAGFFRSDQPPRHAILAHLYQQGLFNPKYCSKHFELNAYQLARYDIDYNDVNQDFAKSIVNHNFNNPTAHQHNFPALSPMIQKSFVTLVVETQSLETTVCFPTEKFLYAVANRRLWIAIAPPGYHQMIEQQFGFQLPSCFDYYFDSVWDDRLRLQLILASLQRFSKLGPDQWKKIYQQQQDILDYNYQRLANMDFVHHVAAKDNLECPIPLGERNISEDEQELWDFYLHTKKSI